MSNTKLIRIMIDVVVPTGTDPADLNRKKVGEQIAKYAQAVALPSATVKPSDPERRTNIHNHERGCKVCEDAAPYYTADQLPNK